MDGHVAVRSLETVEEFRACHAVQKAAWGFPDQMIIPYTQLITMQRNGSVVLGAFCGTDLVGFVFGYLGRQRNGALYIFSQRLAVLPAYQGQGIGEQLKWAQRSWALERGLDRIVWTFDPLLAPNAWLNIAKLGAVARRYECDVFGHSDAPGHSLLPTDRLQLEWELLSERVTDRSAPDWSPPGGDHLLARAGPPLNAVTWNEQGLPVSGPPDLAATGRSVLAEVPADWRDLCRIDITLAQDWRDKVRLLFEHYLGQGYTATGYASCRPANQRRNFYLLEEGA